jgi:hypothetical protein
LDLARSANAFEVNILSNQLSAALARGNGGDFRTQLPTDEPVAILSIAR